VILQDLIAALKELPQEAAISFGFGEPDSYRGYYDQLAFAPKANTTIGDMLRMAEKALGATFYGYKGGEYTMHEYTDCYIAEYGSSDGDLIGPTLMAYWKQEAA
jgi:hypothetical protein